MKEKNMTIILVGSEKGGVGKSVIATNLAVAHAIEGDRVLLVDADRQLTSYYWGARRQEGNFEPQIPFTQIVGDGLGDKLHEYNGQYDIVIIDAAGHKSKELMTALIIADKFISPIQAAQPDADTLQALNEAVQSVQSLRANNGAPALQVGIVINRAPTHPGSTEISDIQEVLANYPALTDTQVILYDRVAFRRAMADGQSVLELKPGDPKAINELSNLFQKVKHEKIQNLTAAKSA